MSSFIKILLLTKNITNIYLCLFYEFITRPAGILGSYWSATVWYGGGNESQLGWAQYLSCLQASGVMPQVNASLALKFLLVSPSQLFAIFWPVTRRVLPPNLNAQLQETTTPIISVTRLHTCPKNPAVCVLLWLPQWLLQYYELLCFFVRSKCHCRVLWGEAAVLLLPSNWLLTGLYYPRQMASYTGFAPKVGLASCGFLKNSASSAFARVLSLLIYI